MISRKNNIFISVILSFTILVGGCTSSSSDSANENGATDELDIVIFKIGKADSILLRVGDQTALIDAGEEDDGEEIIAYMQENDIDTIDYMILTHFDKNHIGGADKILNEV